MDSPTDHLVRFFQDAGDADAPFDLSDTAAKPSSHARRIVDLIPVLEGIDVSLLGHPELRQIEDALTSLQLNVEGLLRRCKEKLGG